MKNSIVYKPLVYKEMTDYSNATIDIVLEDVFENDDGDAWREATNGDDREDAVTGPDEDIDENIRLIVYGGLTAGHGANYFQAAARHGCVNVLQEMMENVDDDIMNSTDDEGNSALHNAVLTGDNNNGPDMIEEMREAPWADLDINLRNFRGNTALHLAVRDVEWDCINEIMNGGPDVSILNLVGRSAYDVGVAELQSGNLDAEDTATMNLILHRITGGIHNIEGPPAPCTNGVSVNDFLEANVRALTTTDGADGNPLRGATNIDESIVRDEMDSISLEDKTINPIQLHPCKHIFSKQSIVNVLLSGVGLSGSAHPICPICRARIVCLEELTAENKNKQWNS
jgi:hypothetical protein